MELKLVFKEESLEVIEFVHLSGGVQTKRRSIRGRTPSPFSDATFMLNSGLKALVGLILDEMLARDGTPPSPIPSLRGGSGSEAATLDYALDRGTSWTSEIFGMDSKGVILLKRLLVTQNSRRRRHGEVVVTFAPRVRRTLSIKILSEKGESLGLEEVQKLRKAFGRKTSGRTVKSLVESPPGRTVKGTILPAASINAGSSIVSLDSLDPLLRQLLRSELLNMLHSAPIFSAHWMERVESRVSHDPVFWQASGGLRLPMGEMDLGLSAANRLGTWYDELTLKKNLSDCKPIDIIVPADLCAAVAILFYLKIIKGYNLRLNYRFSHSPEIVQAIIEGRIDPGGCIVSLYPAGELIAKSRNMRPFMFMPPISRRLVSPIGEKRKASPSTGTYLVLRDVPSTSGGYFQALSHRGLISKTKTTIVHSEPHESTWALSGGDSDVRAVLVFPHYNLNVLFNNCEFLDNSSSELTRVDTVLFLHEETLKERERSLFLNVAIRDAWLDLMEGGKALDSTIDTMLQDQDYVRVLRRVGGLQHINGLKTGPI